MTLSPQDWLIIIRALDAQAVRSAELAKAFESCGQKANYTRALVAMDDALNLLERIRNEKRLCE